MNYILLYEIYRFTETLTKIYNPYKNISEIYEMEECSLPGYHSHRVIVITLLPSNFDYSCLLLHVYSLTFSCRMKPVKPFVSRHCVRW